MAFSLEDITLILSPESQYCHHLPSPYSPTFSVLFFLNTLIAFCHQRSSVTVSWETNKMSQPKTANDSDVIVPSEKPHNGIHRQVSFGEATADMLQTDLEKEKTIQGTAH